MVAALARRIPSRLEISPLPQFLSHPLCQNRRRMECTTTFPATLLTAPRYLCGRIARSSLPTTQTANFANHRGAGESPQRRQNPVATGLTVAILKGRE